MPLCEMRVMREEGGVDEELPAPFRVFALWSCLGAGLCLVWLVMQSMHSTACAYGYGNGVSTIFLHCWKASLAV